MSILRGRLLALLLLSLAFLAEPARAEPAPLRIGVTDSVYPASYRREDGKLVGAMERTLALVAKEAGMPFAVEGYPTSRTQMMVQKGDLDAFVGSITNERKTFALFAPTAMLSAPHGIFYRVGDQSLAKVASMAELIRFRQGSHLGDAWAKENFPADHMEWARTVEDLMKMVEAGRVDYMIGDSASAESRLKTMGLEGKLVFRTLPFLVPLDYRIGLRRGYPGAEEMIARIDQALIKVRTSDDFAAAAAPYH